MSDKTVLITGAGSGLGRHLAQVFSEQHYNLIVTDLPSPSLNMLERKIEPRRNYTVVPGDIRDPKVMAKLIKESEVQNLDVLINNAGVYAEGQIYALGKNEFEAVMEINLLAPMKLTQGIYPIFADKQSGTIINIMSIDALTAKGYQTSYSASKFGMRGFTESLKFEAKAKGIRVIGVYPGGMQTSMNIDRGKDVTKFMDPREVAKIIFETSQRQASCGVDEIVINRQNY